MLSREAMLNYLRDNSPVIAPSMLKCDFGNLNAEVSKIDSAGLPLYHWDVMDGHFVPNLSYGALVIERIRSLTEVPFDAHLMISDPATYVDQYIRIGCEAVTFHIEAVPDPVELLTAIRKQDAVAGLAINPDTPFEAVEPYLNDCDLLLVMSVHPGFGGQAFIPEVMPKLEKARQLAGDRLILSVDGGVAESTIGQCSKAGSNVFVAGSSIFNFDKYDEAGVRLVQAAKAACESVA